MSDSGSEDSTSGATSLSILGWRRAVSDLYARVRAAARPEEGFDLWRAGRDALFADHPDTPLEAPARRGFTGLVFPSYDPAYRFEVSVEPTDAPAHLDVATQGDEVVRMDRIGRVQLGDLGSLDVWWLAQYGGGLFLPMRDTTAGRGSYGAGRYLLDTAKGADLGPGTDVGRGGPPSAAGATTIVVDLNFAYHPSCAYNPRWVCPLAQAGNRLDVDVPVGEQYPADGWPHD